MKAVLVALLCVAAVFAGDYATEEGVLVLTDSTFAQAIEEYDYVLAEFYAPWCGHCKNLAPEYAKAAQELASLPNVKLAKIDCTVEKELANKYEIRGFPTLKFFSKAAGAPVAYEGGRTAGDIVNWLKKKTGPATVTINSVEDAETFLGNNEVVAIFFGPAEGAAYENFVKVANSYDDLAFAVASDESVAQKYEVSTNNIALFKKHEDENKVVYSGEDNVDSIRNWVNDNKDPSVFNFDQKTAQKIFGEGLDALFLITGDNEEGAKAESAVRSLGKHLKSKLAVSVAKFEDNFGARLAEYIGVTKEHLPAIRLVRPSKNNLKYLFEKEINVENIKSFFQDFVEEKLKPFFKSENIPEPDHEENVKIVVGKNFDDVVMNNDRNVLVEYYAPWCGHCKSLAPIYAKLATRLKDNSEVTIAKMDATANEVESVSVQGFPTIKFYPKGNKSNPIDYDGDRTEEGFIEYLKKHGVNVETEQQVQKDEL